MDLYCNPSISYSLESIFDEYSSESNLMTIWCYPCDINLLNAKNLAYIVLK